MRIISLSADGIKNAAQKGFYDWLTEQEADFICVQDLKCSEYDLQDNIYFPQDYNAYFLDDIDGKSNGVAIYCRQLPKAIMTGLGFADFDMEGRYIQADYENLSVGCLLAPQAATGDEAQQERKDEFFALLGGHLQKVRNKRRESLSSLHKLGRSQGKIWALKQDWPCRLACLLRARSTRWRSVALHSPWGSCSRSSGLKGSTATCKSRRSKMGPESFWRYCCTWRMLQWQAILGWPK